MSKINKELDKIKQEFITEVPIFEEYTNPFGKLLPDMACQALFYYYLNSSRTIELFGIGESTAYEKEKDNEVNLKQLFTSIARMYDVEPENMENYWPIIDQQCIALDAPILDFKYKYPASMASLIIH